MDVIDEEENRTPAIERNHARIASGRIAARSRELSFFVSTSGFDAFEKRDVPGLAVNLQDKLIALQAIDKTALLVKNHDIRLNQRGVHTDDLRALAGGSLILRKRQRSAGPAGRREY